jgi:hypothetical protein
MKFHYEVDWCENISMTTKALFLPYAPTQNRPPDSRHLPNADYARPHHIVKVDVVRACLWTAASNGLLLIPQVIYESGEPRWNDIDKGKQKNSERNLSQCHCLPHIPHGLTFRCERPATNCLSYVTAKIPPWASPYPRLHFLLPDSPPLEINFNFIPMHERRILQEKCDGHWLLY